MGDAANGKKVFTRACEQCHTVDKGGKHKVGPNLNAISGKKSGTVAGFAYSDALKNKGVTWSKETLDQWLADPKKFCPGTKMVFAGLKKAPDRADVIAYLESNK